MRLKNNQGMDRYSRNQLKKSCLRTISDETKRRVLEQEKNRESSFIRYGVEPYSIPGIDLFFGDANTKKQKQKVKTLIK